MPVMSPRPNQLALCIDLGLANGAPEEVELIPAGPLVRGRDGRQWNFSATDAHALVDDFKARAADLPIDWEHATQIRAPEGHEAPAAAWIKSLDVRNGALWGAVAWNARGGEQVAAKEYRYLSPVFDFDPKSGRIVRFVSAGLTNKPNLQLQALNQESFMSRSTLLAAAIATLGLPVDATDDVLATAIKKAAADRDEAATRATNAERTQPALDRYVPRADYDALVTRATNAETAIQARDKAEHDNAVESAITDALKAGKITPATAGYHRASCSDAEGLKRFREFVTAAPEIAGQLNLDGKQVNATALNAEQIADKARAYQAEQAKAGNVVTTSAAVRHIMGEKA